MDENKNHRSDDRGRPVVPLQWGDRPDRWTLMLTGPTSGLIGAQGETWPQQPAKYERVDVCVLREDYPVAVFRRGQGEGASSAWHSLELLSFGTPADPLKDGEQLYRAGTAHKLESIEQYRLQMAAIGTAAIGYWKEGDTISPDYDTVPLRDVARLYAKYEALHAAQRKWTKDSVGVLATTIAEAVAKNASTVPQLTFPHIFLHLCDALIEREPTDMEQHQAEMRKVTSWPEANRAAAEIVAFSPPPMVRDALYRDYAVPAKEGGPE